MTQNHNRNYGLDACRTIAILSVVLGHMLGHSSPHPTLAGLSFVGMFGVDLFFCLSGFLIGRILIKEAQDWHLNPQTGLLRFWYRRWMRTLPLYFFFLLVWLKLDWRGATTLADQLPYLLFAQNFAWPMSDFYLLTWSLAVEEWFYYLFPLLLLAVIGFGANARRGVLIVIATFVLIPFIVRIAFVNQIIGLENFDEGVRHIVIFRLDAIGFGVAIAYLYCWHKAWFERLAKWRYLFFVLVIACAAMPKLGYPFIWGNKIGMSIYLTISAVAFAGLIPFFNTLKVNRVSLLSRFVGFSSAISYSLYLGHIIAFIAVIHALKWIGIFDIVYPNPWLTYPLFLMTTYILATITYYGVERPVLQMRDRNSEALAAGLKMQHKVEEK